MFMTDRRSHRSINTHAGSAARLARRILLGLFLGTLLPVLVLRWLPPPASAFMLQAWFASLLQPGEFTLEYRWKPWNEISVHAAAAVVASEDQLFMQHHGFDFKSMRHALHSNRKGRPLRGASTITQQTAKNLFLHAGKSFWRKGLEAYFTVLLEALWPKRRILEMYLNVAQFGKGIYGIGAASQHFFHKDASRLMPTEAALLAAVLPNPLVLRADRPSAYVLRRRQWILRQMPLVAHNDLRGL